VLAEIAMKNGHKVCGTFFDLQKFFDTVESTPLYESVLETGFPMIDALMGYQTHMAPRVYF